MDGINAAQHVPVAQYETQLTAMLQSAQAACPAGTLHIVLTPPAVGPREQSERSTVAVWPYAQACWRVARACGAVCIDVASALVLGMQHEATALPPAPPALAQWANARHLTDLAPPGLHAAAQALSVVPSALTKPGPTDKEPQHWAAMEEQLDRGLDFDAGCAWQQLFYDGLHFSDAGARVITGLLMHAILAHAPELSPPWRTTDTPYWGECAELSEEQLHAAATRSLPAAGPQATQAAPVRPDFIPPLLAAVANVAAPVSPAS